MIRKILVFIFCLGIFGMIPAFVFAQTSTPSAVATSSAKNIVSDEVVRLGESEVVNNDYFGWGERIEIRGTINGDAYLAGGKVVIDGIINGDLLVAGGDVDIKGNVTGDIRTTGGDIKISGIVGGSVTALGGTIELTDKAKIAGSLVAAGGEVNVFSTLGRGITAGAGDMVIGGLVGSSVTAGVGYLKLDSSANINGDLNYWSEDPLDQDSGAIVSGKINHNIPEDKNVDTSAFFAKLGAVFTALSTLAYLLVGLIFLRFFPTFSQKTAETIGSKPLQSLGIGLLSVILTPIIFILLLVTVIGIPLAFLLLFAFIALVYISAIFVAIFIGQKLLSLVNKKASPYIGFIVGLLVYQLFVVIPGVGILVSLVSFFMGIGAVLITKKQVYQSLRSKDSI